MERQSIELLLSEKVNKEVKKFDNHPVLVLAGNNWHEGIIGIVAARIKEKYNKPTILISLKKKIGKGSARSVVGFDIGKHIIKAVQSNIISKGGGHKMAAGFTIDEEKIPSLREFLNNSFEKSNLRNNQGANIYLDSVIAPTALNEKFYEEVNYLSPFGSGNSEPKFVIQDLRVISSITIQDKHIKSVMIGRDGYVIKGFAWNAINSPLEEYLTKNNKKKINIAGKIKLNEWKGEKKIEFMIEDVSIN